MTIKTKKEVAVLDIGTYKISCAIGKGLEKNPLDVPMVDGDRGMRILGASSQLSRGIKRGSVTNLEDLEESIMGAISSAEKDSERAIKSLFVSLPSWMLESKIISTSIYLGQTPVDDVHVSTLLNSDISMHIDTLVREVIHVFPMSYSVNGDEATGIRDPMGMIGEELTAILHVITAPSAIIKNIRNCINRNNIAIEGFVSSTYASGLSVLLNEETQSGVTLVDFGAVTTSVAYFYDGALVGVETIPVGSQNITNDISIILRTSRSHAERLKILHGVAGASLSGSDEQCLVPRIDEYGDEHIQNISRSMLDSIIRARLDEIIELTQKRIKQDSRLSQRIVITGGGSRMSGLNEFIKANRYFEGSVVRFGKPICVLGANDLVQSASFSSSAGAALYCLGLYSSNNYRHSNKTSLWTRIIVWFKRGV